MAPELVLMDMRMPVMDGYEATRRIRSAPGGDTTVIIALTASTLDERMPAMMDAGVDDVVCKPFKEGQPFRHDQDAPRRQVQVRGSRGILETQPGEPVSAKAVSLAGLPAELLAEHAAGHRGLRHGRLHPASAPGGGADPSVAVSLRELAEKYDYDALARIVSESQ